MTEMIATRQAYGDTLVELGKKTRTSWYWMQTFQSLQPQLNLGRSFQTGF